MKILVSFLALNMLLFSEVLSQTMHDFSVTDVHGQQHKLYEDYLNQGKVVVIKFFFTSCPPCIANAPFWQQKYVQHGSGTQGVEFFSVTTITSDYDVTIQGFEAIYNQTMKAVSQDGGAQQITTPFKNGTYGSWWGTPSFAVIAPDRSLVYGVQFNQLDAAIATAKTKVGTVPATIDLQVSTLGIAIPDGHFKVFIHPANSSNPKIEIKKNAGGEYKFSYPSAGIPEMQNPEISIESYAPAYTPLITASDLVVIQRHILGITPFDVPYKLKAADVNDDGRVTAGDLVNIKRAILGLISEFPNDKPSYISIPEKISIAATPGATISPEILIIKVGNVN
jgi:thiol-disulfide isomerase/thioredoxin